MGQFVKENAHLRQDDELLSQELKRIFGEKKEFCDKCDKRLAWCECHDEGKGDE